MVCAYSMWTYHPCTSPQTVRVFTCWLNYLLTELETHLGHVLVDGAFIKVLRHQIRRVFLPQHLLIQPIALRGFLYLQVPNFNVP